MNKIGDSGTLQTPKNPTSQVNSHYKQTILPARMCIYLVYAQNKQVVNTLLEAT